MDLFDLTGKVAVVSGGSRGIGLMMARGLLEAGASVYVSSRKAEAGQAAVAELSKYGVVLSVPADLAREEECVRLAAEVGRFEERVHILVNNAGTNWAAPLAEFPASGWDKVLDLNLKTPFFLTRAFLPLLEAAATADGTKMTFPPPGPPAVWRSARPMCVALATSSPSSAAELPGTNAVTSGKRTTRGAL